MLQITLKEIALLIVMCGIGIELFKTNQSNRRVQKENEQLNFSNRFIYDPIGYKIKSPPSDVILPEMNWDPNEPDLETMIERVKQGKVN